VGCGGKRVWASPEQLGCAFSSAFESMASLGDPFHAVRGEVLASVDQIEGIFREYERARGAGAATGHLAGKIKDAIRTVEWDLQDLDETIRVVEQNPSRFRIGEAEVVDRRSFVSSTRTRVEAIRQHVVASERAEVDSSLMGNGSTASAVDRENERFVESESQMQQMILRQQDEGLDDLASTVARIGTLGRTMHDELEDQRIMLDGLDDEMDHAHNRFGALQEKLNRIIEETGKKHPPFASALKGTHRERHTGRKQFCMIFGLLVAFIVLTMLVVAT